jgi:O-antigen/teichoic acid export membrane protein
VGQVYAAMALVTFVTVTVMTAMNQDFLPRLCESVGRREVFRRQATEQLFVSLMLTAPVVLVVCTFSGEITHLLFSSQFTEAARVVPVMSILVVANISNWPVHTMQTALGYPRDQLSGSIANVLGALVVIGINYKDLSHGTFAAALVVGSLAQLATQSTLLWWREQIAYSAKDWIPGVLLVVTVLWLPFAEQYSPAWGRTAGLAIALVWAGVGLMHYARHRT